MRGLDDLPVPEDMFRMFDEILVEIIKIIGFGNGVREYKRWHKNLIDRNLDCLEYQIKNPVPAMKQANKEIQVRRTS
jgi:hypothetical protein